MEGVIAPYMLTISTPCKRCSYELGTEKRPEGLRRYMYTKREISYKKVHFSCFLIMHWNRELSSLKLVLIRRQIRAIPS
jgi:hypothetical protein